MWGGELRPKHHIMIHLIHKARVMGHPSLWATFRDESLNGVVARIARAAHRTTFNAMAHARFSRSQSLAGVNAMQMN